ncbi:hypothetical protein [Zoogloea sp. 1C4]|uniref:hypothetical protein n=1 Tax=Zoogloea sp. 1C4 TaxID=2570190 RepID=UPI001290E21E|nr:hypothetical protein [Zoogloea sp. 1C4]
MSKIDNRPEVSLRHVFPSGATHFSGWSDYVFIATDAELLADGIAAGNDLPTRRVGNRRMNRLCIGGAAEFSRLRDGRIEASIPIADVARRDAGFQRMLDGILGDWRLSLVAGEDKQ